MNFNASWRVHVGDAAGAEAPGYDDSSWKQVTTPYAWNEDSAFKVSIDELPTGVAWYRKHFRLPAGSGGKKVFLEFEGIRQGGEFFLNGQSIGRSENGVMAFGFDISDKIKGDNVLAARIDNSWNYHEASTQSTFQWNDKNFYANYGGINKNVNLYISDRLYQTLPLFSSLGTSGVYIYARNFDIPAKTATITAQTQVKNEYATPKNVTYQVVIEDMAGKVVRTLDGGGTSIPAGQTKVLEASGRVNGLKFWSWGYGYLYNVYTVLSVDGRPIDVVKTRTGFRKTEFGQGMVKLNDRAIQMHGYAQRTTNEWPAIGLSVPDWMSDYSNQLMVKGGANLVRWMHVTPWKQDVESCDRAGLMESMPAGDSERDVEGRRWELRTDLMRDAIIYNRNNPSIVFYESGNNGVSEQHMAEMKAIRLQYDPFGGRASGSRDMLDSKVADYGGEMLYINKSATIPFWAMEYSRDEGLRKYWDEFTPPFHKEGQGPPHNGEDASAYNHNQDAQAIEDVRRWYDYWRERPGTGKRVDAGGVNIIFSDSNTHHRGESSYRTSGEVDAMRLPKDGYFANQVMWDGWVDVEHPRAHILGHWNYAAGIKKTVTVVSSAEKVELLVNGHSSGFGEQSSRFLFSFKNISWQPGQIRAVGYDVAGKVVCEDSLRTAGPPVALKLTPHAGPGGWKANGADLAFFDIEVVDAQGSRCPTALNLVHFALSGPAQWRGGIAQGPDNYILSTDLPVECGINRVLVRSDPTAGKITLMATASGLKPVTATLVSIPVIVKDGLIMNDGTGALPSYLGRGPTPTTPSFKMHRVSLQIVGAKAGANSDQAGLSFDDNEKTSWANDGSRATGWIQYNLAKPAKISEITLKMGGWRSKSYPIRISIDGHVAFEGSTPPSLGYVTLPLKPTIGSKVIIELVGAATQKDNFGNIVELENQANATQTGGQSSAKGSLDIVEAEIYAAVS